MASLGAQTPPPFHFELVSVDPAGAGILPLNRTLYVKIHYESARPFRAMGRGFFRGEKREDITNPSPLYPAGTGDALVWISYRQPTSIDSIVITVSDAAWKPALSFSTPVMASWQAGAPERPEAPWVREISDEQQRQVSAAMKASNSSGGENLLGGLFFIMLYLSVLAYPILQMRALWRDGLVSLSGLPLLLMVPVISFTLYALSAGSNLWPIYLLFASPVACLFLLAVTFLRGVS